MLIDIICIFPDMLSGFIHQSIVKRAQEKGLVRIRLFNLRDFSFDKHKTVDDIPYGGGPGMILKPEPLYRAILQTSQGGLKPLKIFLTPQGNLFSQRLAREFSKEQHLVFVCGHYEGIDQRIRDFFIDEEISIGDYVLTGGEVAAAVVTDAIIRLIPGVLGSKESLHCESFSDYLFDYPQYTRPAAFKTMEVPKILLSGHHEEIRKWRKKKALLITAKKRPDQFQKINLTDEDTELLKDTS